MITPQKLKIFILGAYFPQKNCVGYTLCAHCSSIYYSSRPNPNTPHPEHFTLFTNHIHSPCTVQQGQNIIHTSFLMPTSTYLMYTWQ